MEGKNLLLLTIRTFIKNDIVSHILSDMNSECNWTVRTLGSNPDIDTLDALGTELKDLKISGILAVGGGSVIDSAKVMSVLLNSNSTRPLHNHFRVGLDFDFSRSLPTYCVPTTSGTGAEVTPFATVWDESLKRKFSLTHPALYPKIAVLDYSLTTGLPWRETLYSAMDAISHSLETLWNRDATPISISFALRSLDLVIENLNKVKRDPSDAFARLNLLEAANLAGLAISQNRTALAHSISYPLTARFGVPHGLACSFSLGAIISMVNRKNAWSIAPSFEVCDSILEIISDNNLSGRLLEYCKTEEIFGCLGEMFSPERVNNFVLQVTKEDVNDLLHNCFH